MKKFITAAMALSLVAGVAKADFPQAETLDRGLVAVKPATGVMLSWRLLESDSPDIAFDVYRDGEKITETPFTRATSMRDPNGTVNSKYVVKAVLGGQVIETTPEVSVAPNSFLRVMLDRPADGTISGVKYTYTPNDMSVGDVDGDGRYELFVKWDPSNSQDNSIAGYTGNVYIDCYTLEGEKLWRIDLGRNIRAGAHYTQFMVYDFDQDGKAEMIVKTAPGTIDGQGNAVLMGNDKATDLYVNSKGYVISGPEYLTVFNGQTGAQINTIAYNPPRTAHPQDKSSNGWGDSYGGRSERYLAAVAYLDGQKPSAVFCRGYYTHSYLWAVDFDGSKLTEKWLHASTTKGQGAYGEGAHSLTVGDVDGDGKDEIVYGSCSIDHDGKLLYRTGAGHGDALHLGDFDPDRPGLEVFMVHEETSSAYKYDAECRDAATGQIIWSLKQSGHDIGRGLVADVSANWRGHEMWPSTSFEVNPDGIGTTFDCHGNIVAEKRHSTNFRIYWDGDLLDELFDGSYDSAAGKSMPSITKPNADIKNRKTLMNLAGQSCNTTKGTPCLQADLFGDWREEVILWNQNNPSEIFIHTTTTETNYRIPCLMQDHNYRLAIAWQNVAYNQPPHLSYNLYARYQNDPILTITSGSLNQSIELGYPIATIAGTFERATGVKATGLPDGVQLTVDEAAKTFRLEGTPTAEGTYKIKIQSVGGTSTTTLNGSISVLGSIALTRVAHFSFDQVGATVTNHVEGEATATGSPVATEGKSNGAILFNGTTDYLTQPAYDKIQLGASDFTIELLFNSTDDAAYMLHKGSTVPEDAPGATGNWIGLEYKNGNLKFAVDDNENKSEASVGATQCFDGKWHHIVLTREAASAKLRIYIDGTLAAESTDNTGAVNDNNELLVIANVNNKFNNFFAGAMDDLSIYTGAMSEQKVAERYNGYFNSGITEVVPGSVEPRRLTLIDATTGITVATGVGENTNVTDGAAPGVYILVVQQGVHNEILKIRL